jgi:hypothetical protein
VFTAAENLAGSLASGRKPGLLSLAIRVFSPAYKRAYKQAVLLRTSGKAGAKQVLDELNEVAAVLQLWKKWSGTQALPIRVDEAAACQQLCLKAEASLRDIEGWSKLRWRELPIPDVLARVQAHVNSGYGRARLHPPPVLPQSLQKRGAEQDIAVSSIMVIVERLSCAQLYFRTPVQLLPLWRSSANTS